LPSISRGQEVFPWPMILRSTREPLLERSEVTLETNYVIPTTAIFFYFFLFRQPFYCVTNFMEIMNIF